MKVFNITDASTAALRSQGLENQHIKVGETVIPPGGSVVLRGTAKERSELQVYVKVGAVSLEELPVLYATRRNLTIYGEKIPQVEPAKSLNEPSEQKMFELVQVEEDPEPPKRKGGR